MGPSYTIDPDLLRSFVLIAETGSFTRVASMVGRSQAAVSLQVKRLETRLGVIVLSRGKGGSVRLTAQGRRLLPRAKAVLAANDAIWEEVRGSPADEGPPSPEDYGLPLRAQREAFTAQLMLTLLTNDKFSAAYALVMQCVERGEVVDVRLLTPEKDALFMSLLSMLEYVSVNFLSHTIDRAAVLRQRRTGLLRVYETLAGYIDYKRVAWRRPAAYRSFEMVVKHHILDGFGRELSVVPASAVE